MESTADSLTDILESALPVPLRHILLRLRDVGRQLDMRTALVGGIPRDLLRIRHGQLHRDAFADQLRDFDVAVEGDGLRFAYDLRRRLPGDLTVNKEFHTATLVTADPMRIDIATARLEEYPLPGRLPVVHTAGVSLESDMARRDFSVNAIGLDVSHDFGRLLDPHGGVGDIREGVVRILHPGSFSDDPTRLFRALRYSMRLGYDLEPTTREHYTAAVDEGAPDHLSPERIRYELECIASEERWAEVWAVMDLSGLTGSIARPLAGISRDWTLEDARALDIAVNSQRELLQREDVPAWLVRTAWALQAAPAEQLGELIERLGLYTVHRRWLGSAQRMLREAVPKLAPGLRPSQVSRLLELYPRQGVVLALLIYQPRTQAGVAARKEMLRYLEEYALVRSTLDGNDLIALGLKPGPVLGEVRDQLRYLRLDGVIRDKETEREYARKLIRRVTQEGPLEPAADGKNNKEVQ